MNYSTARVRYLQQTLDVNEKKFTIFDIRSLISYQSTNSGECSMLITWLACEM